MLSNAGFRHGKASGLIGPFTTQYKVPEVIEATYLPTSLLLCLKLPALHYSHE